jgi:hypothetical protein
MNEILLLFLLYLKSKALRFENLFNKNPKKLNQISGIFDFILNLIWNIRKLIYFEKLIELNIESDFIQMKERK